MAQTTKQAAASIAPAVLATSADAAERVANTLYADVDALLAGAIALAERATSSDEALLRTLRELAAAAGARAAQLAKSLDAASAKAEIAYTQRDTHGNALFALRGLVDAAEALASRLGEIDNCDDLRRVEMLYAMVRNTLQSLSNEIAFGGEEE